MSNFAYNGIVTISYTINGVTKQIRNHNAGTNKLFEFFAMALSGDLVSSLLPAYIDLVNRTGTPPVDTTVLSSKFPVLSYYLDKIEDNDTTITNVCRIACNIPMSYFKGTANVIKLFASDGDTLLADSPITIDTTSMTGAPQLMITWDLYVTNPPQS